MPRIVRGLADNVVYHIINRGNGRQEVFHKDKDYEAFIVAKIIGENNRGNKEGHIPIYRQSLGNLRG